jgi:hypothetical protein
MRPVRWSSSLRSLSLTLLIAGALAAPRPAFAQVRPFVGGMGAFAFQTASTAEFNVRGGVSLNDHIDVFGEVGHLVTLLPKDELDLIRANEARTTVQMAHQGSALSGRAGTTQGLVGVRWSAPVGWGVRPFAEAGGGMARISQNFSVATSDGIDITPQSLSGTYALALPKTVGMFMAGAGATLFNGELTDVDLGYRWSQYALETASSSSVAVGHLYLAVHHRF